MQWARKQKGFTIVELLIVIVVIAILAAITIVAYNGIQNRTKESALMTAVSQAVKKVENFKSASSTESYPTTAAQAGIATIDGLTFLSNTDIGNYCIEVVNGQLAYSATKDVPTPTKGDCGENGLVGWWKFNGNADDATGNGWNATTAGVAAQGQDGQAGGSLQFNGTVPTTTVPDSESILPASATFSFWYYADSWNGSSATSFIAKRSGATTGIFIMRLSSGGRLVVDCAGQNNRWDTGYSLPLNVWTHITVACAPRTASAYVNGTLVGTNSQATGSMGSTTLLQFAQDSSNGYALNGRMDDIRLFNRALGQAEAQKLFSDGAQ